MTTDQTGAAVGPMIGAAPEDIVVDVPTEGPQTLWPRVPRPVFITKMIIGTVRIAGSRRSCRVAWMTTWARTTRRG